MHPDAIEREERNPIGPTRTDKRRAGHDLESRHGCEELRFVDGIRADPVRMQLLESKDVSVDLADDLGNAARVVLPIGANAAMDIVGRHHEVCPGGGCARAPHLSHDRPRGRRRAGPAVRAMSLRRSVWQPRDPG
jgi:hypothetical protein